MGTCLKKLIIAATGDLGPGKGNEQLKRWVEQNGGRWTPKIVDSTTHLISSKDAYKRRVDTVKQAKKVRAFIVSFDWLEDSLSKRQRLKEDKYTWDVLQRQHRTRKGLKRLGAKFDGVVKVSQRLCYGERGCPVRYVCRCRELPTTSARHFASALEDLWRRIEAREEEEEACLVRDSATANDGQTNKSITNTAEAFIFNTGPSTAASKVLQISTKASTKPDFIASSFLNGRPSRKAKLQSRISASFPKGKTPLLQPSFSSASLSSTQAIVSTKSQTHKLADLYHIYCDATGFDYDLMFLRINIFLNSYARYDLRLYESHIKPHTYCTFVRYQPPADSTTRKEQKTEGKDEKTARAVPGSQSKPQHKGDDPKLASAETANDPAAYLWSFVNILAPSSSLPYRSLICPTNSTFAAAYAAFRHAFQDLTLLTWEERHHPPPMAFDKFSTQRLRAIKYGIEPYQWGNRPKRGMPAGLRPAIEGVMVDEKEENGQVQRRSKPNQNNVVIPGEEDEQRYIRNRWSLPAVDEALGSGGGIGSALFRESLQEKRAREEKAADEERRRGLIARIEGVKLPKKAAKKVSYNHRLAF